MIIDDDIKAAIAYLRKKDPFDNIKGENERQAIMRDYINGIEHELEGIKREYFGAGRKPMIKPITFEEYEIKKARKAKTNLA